MLNKVLGYGVVAVMLVALVGGTVYILARPSEAQAERGLSHDAISRGGSGYRGGGAGAVEAIEPATRGDGERGTGSGNGRGQETGGRQGGGQGSGTGQPLAEGELHEWLTVQGTVVAVDSEMTVQTSTGDVIVGLGQAWYREEAGFVVDVGDEVVVQGFYEDGEFKAGTVDNSTTGATITLRDATGRPMWAGRGNGQNRP